MKEGFHVSQLSLRDSDPTAIFSSVFRQARESILKQLNDLVQRGLLVIKEEPTTVFQTMEGDFVVGTPIIFEVTGEAKIRKLENEVFNLRSLQEENDNLRALLKDWLADKNKEGAT